MTPSRPPLPAANPGRAARGAGLLSSRLCRIWSAAPAQCARRQQDAGAAEPDVVPWDDSPQW